MNAQTRREMAEVLAARVGERVRTLAYPDCGNVKLIDQALCEWGLEMARIANDRDSGLIFSESGQRVVEDTVKRIVHAITAANDQQKGA